ncbi:GNAT family N-acetyltransferase [Kribbella sp. NPDC058245]|uniref:GNAT family N-acetyltransferase n=1 Tax=Kribbella sp. NPDC058245 TaxID=3346399 RepID=UPI0036EF8FFF
MIKPRQLTTSVALRLAALDDAAALADAYTRSWDHLKPWEPTRPDDWFTPEGQRTRLTSLLANFERGTTVPLLLAEGDRIVGAVTLNDLVHGPFSNAHVGYWLATEAVGRGLMTLAVEAAAELADTELKLHRLQASVFVHNAASHAVLERTGFTQIGFAPNYLYIGGRWQDSNLFQRILNDRAPGT